MITFSSGIDNDTSSAPEYLKSIDFSDTQKETDFPSRVPGKFDGIFAMLSDVGAANFKLFVRGKSNKADSSLHPARPLRYSFNPTRSLSPQLHDLLPLARPRPQSGLPLQCYPGGDTGVERCDAALLRGSALPPPSSSAPLRNAVGNRSNVRTSNELTCDGNERTGRPRPLLKPNTGCSGFTT